MRAELRPWAVRPFELIVHAEVHYRAGTDYDRRLALVSYDNAIEVSIVTYLNLNPIQRGNRQYPNAYVARWLNNYHTKIDFFIEEINNRQLPVYQEKQNIIWYHDQRNNQYHGPSSGVPSISVLDDIKGIAIWVFSVLFEEVDIQNKIDKAISKGEVSILSIPKKYSVPGLMKPEQEKSLLLASLLGGWNERNEEDREVIRRLVDGF